LIDDPLLFNQFCLMHNYGTIPPCHYVDETKLDTYDKVLS